MGVWPQCRLPCELRVCQQSWHYQCVCMWTFRSDCAQRHEHMVVRKILITSLLVCMYVCMSQVFCQLLTSIRILLVSLWHGWYREGHVTLQMCVRACRSVCACACVCVRGSILHLKLSVRRPVESRVVGAKSFWGWGGGTNFPWTNETLHLP